MHLRIAFLLGLLLLSGGPVLARAAKEPKPPRGLPGTTATLKAFQSKYHYTPEMLRERLGAVGRIVCPWGLATAFLAEQADVIVTAAHLFVDIDKKPLPAKDRGKVQSCTFQPLFLPGRYRLAAGTLTEGIRARPWADPMRGTDWAVARLERPVPGAHPFRFAAVPIAQAMAVMTVAQGFQDMTPRLCAGSVDLAIGGEPSWYAQTSAAEPKASSTDPFAFTTSCGVDHGASGGPVLVGSPGDFPADGWPVLGITSGWLDFSSQNHGIWHHAVPITGRVVVAVAGLLMDGERLESLAKTYLDTGAGPDEPHVDTALALYRLAARARRPQAYATLGMMLASSPSPVPVVAAEAYMWLRLALDTLPADDPRRAPLRARLYSLEVQLSSERIADAVAKARAIARQEPSAEASQVAVAALPGQASEAGRAAKTGRRPGRSKQRSLPAAGAVRR